MKTVEEGMNEGIEQETIEEVMKNNNKFDYPEKNSLEEDINVEVIDIKELTRQRADETIDTRLKNSDPTDPNTERSATQSLHQGFCGEEKDNQTLASDYTFDQQVRGISNDIAQTITKESIGNSSVQKLLTAPKQ